MFKFGDNKMIKSLIKIQFPGNNAGVSGTIAIDVMTYDILLLFSKEAMKKVNAKIGQETVKHESSNGKAHSCNSQLKSIIKMIIND